MIDMINVDGLSLAIATGLATLMVLALKALFSFVRTLAKATPTELDDKIVDQTESTFKDKSQNL